MGAGIGGGQPRARLCLSRGMRMAWYHEIASSIGALFGRRRQETDMSEELQFHIAMETRRLVDMGLAEAEARRKALRDFGGVERHKDDVRDERGTGWFEEIGRAHV